MDTAVAMVQAYLHVNGYFTVTEYPILDIVRGGQVRTVTDLDVLAYRFPNAGDDVQMDQPRRGRVAARLSDPVLGAPKAGPDMIVGEVKEGRARLNPAMRDPLVIESALLRFGCCPPAAATELATRLLAKGAAGTPSGHLIRMVAFGDAVEGARTGPWTTVAMSHVVRFLQAYLREHWSVLRHAQFHDPTFATLALLEKWKVRDGR